jgi:hypothetical protein
MIQMAQTRTITVYSFSELNDDAKAYAIEAYRSAGMEPAWCDEWIDSMRAFEKVAPVYNVTFEAGGYRCASVSFEPYGGYYIDDVMALSGVRAWKWLVNNGWRDLATNGDCPLTGYCGDEDLLDAIRKALKNPKGIASIYDVFNDCLHDWVFAFNADLEHQESDEYIAEMLEENGYEFMGDGSPA